MPVEVLWALMSAASFALSHVVSKRGLQDTSITAGFIVIVSSALAVVTLPVLLDPPAAVVPGAVAIFALSGLFAPAIARAAALAGVQRLGPSIAVPIQQGLRPLLVLPAAALLLGEEFGALRVAGALAIVTGGWVLSRQPVAATEFPMESAPDEEVASSGNIAVRTRLRPRTTPRFRGFRPGVVYPLAAAMAYATADLLVKSGLDGDAEPAFGAMVSICSALVVWTIAHAFPTVRRRFRLGRGVAWLVLAGVLMGSAILVLFNALERGDLSVVAPVVASQPLFVFLFSALLLRHLETLDAVTLLGGAFVVVGTIAVSI
ncbi:MAG: EamA family transporter [Acidimicrobiales bacterium]